MSKPAVNVTQQLCEQLEDNKKNIVDGKIVNPVTGRKVAAKNATIKKMEKDCVKFLKGKKISTKSKKSVSKKPASKSSGPKKVSPKKQAEYESCKVFIAKGDVVGEKIKNPFSNRYIKLKSQTATALEKKCQKIIEKFEKKKTTIPDMLDLSEPQIKPATPPLPFNLSKSPMDTPKPKKVSLKVQKEIKQDIMELKDEFNQFEKDLEAEQSGPTAPTLDIAEDIVTELDKEMEELTLSTESIDDDEDITMEDLDKALDLDVIEEEGEEKTEVEAIEVDDTKQEVQKQSVKKEKKNKKHFDELITKLKSNEMTNTEINDYLTKYKIADDIHYLKQIIVLKLSQMV